MKTVFITGATSGIGRAFARRFARMGYRLILSGRREDRLSELALELDVPVRILPADLDKEEECFRLLSELQAETIHVFINNAGFGTCGVFTETSLEKEISMVHVNDIAMHILFKGILQKMEKRGRGVILNVASSAGLLPCGPYMAGYYASKAYMVSLTRAVAQELKERGSSIYVCALCPGPVDTEFNDNADVIFALNGISPEQCVSEALAGMKKRRTVIVPTFALRAAMSLQGFLPMPLLVRITARQQKRKFSEEA